MKKITSLLIGCSLGLAGAAFAQQPVEHQSPSTNKHAPEKAHANQAQPKPQAPPATHPGTTQQQHGATHDTGAMKQQGAGHEHGATNEPGAIKGHNAPTHQQSATTPKTNVSGEPAGTSTPTARQQRVEQRRKGMKGEAATKTTTNPAGPAAGAAGTGATSPVPAAGQQNAQANMGAKAKKPDPQQVQQIKSQHANFRAQPKPQQIPAVTYNQNYRIQGSDRWQGQHYEVFRSYHPQWHDQGWYHSHYNRVELIGGGYYFFNNGYWFPAWGYSPSAQYYAYDGPIYAGQHAEPPDKVIADVQSVLQQMGYYKGEVDGLLGPLTREALTAYQGEQGLAQTAAIDEPTLDSLGMS
ncbi:MAG TPA: peptidoglycan-binding protein [Candidatus Udaeobacter sp.]|nr:peptidoglycan-binding protein [Candidatus Udaeobacter sp.]